MLELRRVSGDVARADTILDARGAWTPYEGVKCGQHQNAAAVQPDDATTRRERLYATRIIPDSDREQ